MIANDVVYSKRIDAKAEKVIVHCISRESAYKHREIAYRGRESARPALKILVKAVSAYRGREGACRGRKSSCKGRVLCQYCRCPEIVLEVLRTLVEAV
jgi:hypothetical protein